VFFDMSREVGLDQTCLTGFRATSPAPALFPGRLASKAKFAEFTEDSGSCEPNICVRDRIGGRYRGPAFAAYENRLTVDGEEREILLQSSGPKGRVAHFRGPLPIAWSAKDLTAAKAWHRFVATSRRTNHEVGHSNGGIACHRERLHVAQ
jgi:hypothetical protein